MFASSVPGPGLRYVGEHTSNPSLECIIQGVQQLHATVSLVLLCVGLFCLSFEK